MSESRSTTIVPTRKASSTSPSEFAVWIPQRTSIDVARRHARGDTRTALIPAITGGIAWALLFSWLSRIGTGASTFLREAARVCLGKPHANTCMRVHGQSTRQAVQASGQGARRSTINDQWYFADPRMVPTAAAGYEYRLPCSWFAANGRPPATLPPIARIWGHRTLPRIRIRWNGTYADFGLPAAREVAERLRQKVIALQ